MDLYNELRSGRTADEIAKAFTEQLNAAEARIKDEEAKAAAEALAAEEAKRTAALKAEVKRHDMVALLDEAMTFLSTHYPELGVDAENMSNAALVALADFILSLLDLEVVKHKIDKKSVKVDFKFNPSKKTVPVDDVFADFFKSVGL